MLIFYEPAAGFQVLSIESLWKQILTTIALWVSQLKSWHSRNGNQQVDGGECLSGEGEENPTDCCQVLGASHHLPCISWKSIDSTLLGVWGPCKSSVWSQDPVHTKCSCDSKLWCTPAPKYQKLRWPVSWGQNRYNEMNESEHDTI